MKPVMSEALVVGVPESDTMHAMRSEPLAQPSSRYGSEGMGQTQVILSRLTRMALSGRAAEAPLPRLLLALLANDHASTNPPCACMHAARSMAAMMRLEGAMGHCVTGLGSLCVTVALTPCHLAPHRTSVHAASTSSAPWRRGQGPP